MTLKKQRRITRPCFPTKYMIKKIHQNSKKLTVLAQPLVYHAIHPDKAAGEYQTLCHKPQYRLADLARRRSEESHEGKHDGCDDTEQRCRLLITDTLHDKNLLLEQCPSRLRGVRHCG